MSASVICGFIDGSSVVLSISKQLAELMGGHIGVNSTLGDGSEFWFSVRLGLP